uniref:Uncharacterized protein n=2 Tax=Cacao swollen shoot virus TaxID=31559 RepID=A0A6M3R3Q7_9VIRU|nr:hypothetical protein [Cacao swollen shoot virus]
MMMRKRMKSLQNGIKVLMRMKILMKKKQLSQFGIKKRRRMNMILMSTWLICKRKKMSGKKSPPACMKKWSTHGGSHKRRLYFLKRWTTTHLLIQ